ncbi:MAG: nucleotide exchange factor GrpE [Candidatus Saccharimonadales bacterium]
MTDKKSPKTSKKEGELLLQIAELTEALKRERADAINASRRHEEQLTGVRQHARASVVRELLPDIENFERALKHVPKGLESGDFVKGVTGIVKQFEKTLSDLGVQKIKTDGELFNPESMEAVSVEDGDGTDEIVSEELQAGYKLGPDVIRHAMVRVKRQ